MQISITFLDLLGYAFVLGIPMGLGVSLGLAFGAMAWEAIMGRLYKGYEFMRGKNQ